MAKAVLVMDMPERCNNCYAAYMSTTGEFICRAAREKIPPKPRKRPYWCPLRELPKHKRTIGTVDEGEKLLLNAGWNDCLDEILKRRKE